ncbi:hypothetical protein [Actinophytocola sp.]|uniref:hypothetical protein n=1 Tax=Actinophytocola sp. TaxID=1872138 RepID=UPI002ED3650F
MRIRTMAGIALAGTAFAVVGGVAYASADESEPTLRIVTEQEQPAQELNCPEKGSEGTGL